ncbi:MAG TPA: SUMF1/EgtB/PvdO family nonheme iron enzyme [Candidatus Eremiobacteraeota bacterium]|nr:MAG: Serine/threonine-protein kinase pkn1 [bacterium ADurb.Bin363]HPZ06576.1 SUMF1/EgtB/PvdO family nonheme iron enzyme [Candidatus Eremiobacteraeota bacterium]
MIGKNIKCGSCGASLDVPDGFNKLFCTYCGSQNLLTDVLDIPGVTLVCLKCNTKNKDENIFCDKCGGKLQQKCRYCGETHPVNKNFCPKTGLNIEQFSEAVKTCLLNLRMLLIPGGTFQMGSNKNQYESPPHQVKLTNFYMSNYSVTNTEYNSFLNSTGNQIEGKVQWMQIENNEYCGINKDEKFTVKEGYEHRPLVYVSWFGSVAYCNWLSEQEGLEKCYGDINYRGQVDVTKNGYRLPTEAEWEYACRAGTTTDYYWGDTMNDAFCWHSGNSQKNHHNVGTAGGGGHPNNFGLFDMSGNVWEWCSDWFGNYPSTPVVNPVGPKGGTYRVVRGGSWNKDAHQSRSANRSSIWPGSRSHSLGFRIAKTQ